MSNMTKIFISYRRADSQETTDRLHDQMVSYFGEQNVFQDVDKIPFGFDFRAYLRDEIANCDVVLVVIGRDWAHSLQERSDDQSDFVRIEVEQAIKLKKLVIPVTVRGAEMPRPDQLPESVRELVWFNRAIVRPNPDFKNDCKRLADGIKHSLNQISARNSIEQTSLPPLSIREGLKPQGQTPTAPVISSVSAPITLPLPTERGAGGEVSPKPDSLQEALSRARDFHKTGKRNSDWKPFITTFPDLKIPDMPFCLVPTGRFQMGNDEKAYYYDKKWVLGVPDGGMQTFDQPFYIAQYPVTNAQWKLAVEAGVVRDPQKGRYDEGEPVTWYNDPQMANSPVTGINWEECQKFAAWMNCRLPTEREWEYAARGVDNLIFPWGNEFISDNAVYTKNSGRKPNDVLSRSSGASWVAAAHLSGNIGEWCQTRYKSYPYIEDDGREDYPAEGGRVLRGASWGDVAHTLRLATRINGSPSLTTYLRGFRLARSI